MPLKLNLGSGLRKREGFLNIDKFPDGNPDRVWDLEMTPWDLPDNSTEEVLLNHTLEHLGGTPDVFLAIMKELYRVCIHKARIEINVPHPRNDHFLNDPTHVRAITPGLLALFSKRSCLHWQKLGLANTPLALYLGVDFEIVSRQVVVEKKYMDQLAEGVISREELEEMIQTRNNVASEYRFVIQPLKQGS
jgi:hypothetical protein